MISEKVKLFYAQTMKAAQDRDLAKLDQLADEFIAPNCVWHDPTMPDHIGPEGQKQFNQGFLEACTDIQIRTDDLVEAGDKMIWRTSAQFKEIASGNVVHMCSIEIDKIAGDQIIESWTAGIPGSW